nr:VWA domain-containing protein [Candidatus Sigynarchaeota archaeon]
MPGIPPEDVIILLDTSRSMSRRDFAPSRLVVTLRALGQLITKKFEIDANDRIGLVFFGTKAQKIQEPTSNAAVLLSALKSNVDAGGGSEIADGLALSIQALGSEIRKIGGKIVRILLFSDDKLGSMTNRLIKLANAAKGLGIFID